MHQGRRQLTLSPDSSLIALADAGRGLRGERFLLDGRGDLPDAWQHPGLVGLEPRCILRVEGRDESDVESVLARIEGLLKERRRPSLDGATGLAILLSYEALNASPGFPGAEPFPAILVFAIDASLQLAGERDARLCVRADTEEQVERELDRWSRRLENLPSPRLPGRLPEARSVIASLPRDRYLDAISLIQGWIAQGTFYQANLCQRFDAVWSGNALDYFAQVCAEQIVPRSAFLSIDDLHVASFSPETFVTVREGMIETLPIKGTRPRGRDAAADREAIADLLAAPKDRAELLMIVDLERNDLGRLCVPGSVEVPELAVPQSYPAVHHLVARVRGRLRDDVGWTDIIRAVFPGGSITGAPKKSAMERLRGVEPVPRGPFTGSLFWCGDDGSLDSSILIRTAVFAGERVMIGAGGGIVADSRADDEWSESNHKARALTSALGFEPEDLL